MAYATIADLEDRLGTSDDGSFAALLDAASRRVEAYTRRQFNKEDEASPRRFRAVDPQRLPVDDFYTTTDLVVDVAGTVLDPAVVDPRPWDGIVNGQTGWPFFDLFRTSGFWPHSRRATVTVTARWGWEAVPEGIRQATLDVAAVLSSGGGSVRSEMLGDHQITYFVGESEGATPTELLNAEPYRRKIFGVA